MSNIYLNIAYACFACAAGVGVWLACLIRDYRNARRNALRGLIHDAFNAE